MEHEELTGKVIGAAMRVHSALGSGFQEVIYQRALEVEFECQEIGFVRELEMRIFYREKDIGSRRVDFFVGGVVMVELKAISELEPVHFAQAMNYLEVYEMKIGLLLNFGEQSLKHHRLTNKKLP